MSIPNLTRLPKRNALRRERIASACRTVGAAAVICLNWPTAVYAASEGVRARLSYGGQESALLDFADLRASVWQLGMDSLALWGHHGADGGSHRRCGVGVEDVAIFAVLGAVAVTWLRTRRANGRQRLDLARNMLERGIEPPPELLAPPGNDLQRGIVLMFLGVGLLLASYVSRGADLSPAGLVPCFVGVGYLLSHRFATKAGN